MDRETRLGLLIVARDDLCLARRHVVTHVRGVLAQLPDRDGLHCRRRTQFATRIYDVVSTAIGINRCARR